MTGVEQVLNIAKSAWVGGHRFRKVCVLFTFDVRNAFNSVGWEDILEALKYDLEVDEYIQDIVDDYFRNRKLGYVKTKGTYEIEVTAGVPQGAALGPDR